MESHNISLYLLVLDKSVLWVTYARDLSHLSYFWFFTDTKKSTPTTHRLPFCAEKEIFFFFLFVKKMMNTLMQELRKAPSRANICYLVLVWCRHVPGKMQQAELLPKTSPLRGFPSSTVSPTLQQRSAWTINISWGHHEQPPHNFYPKNSQSLHDPMEHLTLLSGAHFETRFFF